MLKTINFISKKTWRFNSGNALKLKLFRKLFSSVSEKMWSYDPIIFERFLKIHKFSLARSRSRNKSSTSSPSVLEYCISLIFWTFEVAWINNGISNASDIFMNRMNSHKTFWKRFAGPVNVLLIISISKNRRLQLKLTFSAAIGGNSNDIINWLWSNIIPESNLNLNYR